VYVSGVTGKYRQCKDLIKVTTIKKIKRENRWVGAITLTATALFASTLTFVIAGAEHFIF
jgi:hypothetical protein